MNKIVEKEKKYLVDNVRKAACWEKEHIVYQWYIECTTDKSVKIKLIFDLLKANCILVKVSKTRIGIGEFEKSIEYGNVMEFDVHKMLGIPFVAKRRAIMGRCFLDKFIVSNGVCEYLLEIEDDGIEGLSCDVFEIGKDVTSEDAFYNQNMSIPFGKDDLDRLFFLLKLYCW